MENVSLYNKTLKMGLYREKMGKWNMKKTGIVICVLAALVGLVGCSSVVSSDKTDRTKSGIESQGKFKVNTPDEEWFKETALDVAASVNELANDEAYIKIMGGSDDVAEVASDWGDNIADTSGKIAVVIISDKAAKFIMGQTDGETSLSDTARDRVEKNACLAFGNYVTASAGGASALAASSILRYDQAYVVSEPVLDQVWVIPAGEECALWIAYSNCGDGIVSVSGSYMALPDGQTVKEAADSLFSTWGLEVEVHEW